MPEDSQCAYDCYQFQTILYRLAKNVYHYLRARRKTRLALHPNCTVIGYQYSIRLIQKFDAQAAWIMPLPPQSPVLSIYYCAA